VGFDRRRGAGVSGIIDMMGAGGNTVQFNARIYGWSQAFKHAIIDRHGRSSGGVIKFRLGDLSGGGKGQGKVEPSWFPVPSSIKNAGGNLTIQVHDGCRVTVPVKITNIAISYAEKAEDVADINFDWQITGVPTWTWGGSQKSVSAPANSEVEIYDGLSKFLDPQGLVDGATQNIDIEGIGDSDSDEITRIAGIVAAAVTPVTGLKIVDYAFSRTDSNGGRLAIKWGHVDHKDERENPEYQDNTDPHDLETYRTRALVYTTASPPVTPATPSGQKLDSYRDVKIHDTKSIRFYRWQKTDSKDRAELPERWEKVDPNGIASQASDSLLDGTPVTPAGYVNRGVTTKNLTTDHYLNVVEAGLRSTVQDVEFPGTFVNKDDEEIETTGQKTVVHDTGSTPSDPTPPTESIIFTSKTTELNINKSVTEWNYKPLTSKQEVEAGGTRAQVDPDSLVITGQQTVVYTIADGAPIDGTFTPPAGGIVAGSYTRQLSQTKSSKIAMFASMTPRQELEAGEGSIVRLDPKEIETHGQQTKVYTTADGAPSDGSFTVPSDAAIFDYYTVQLSQTKSKKVVGIKPLDSEQAIEIPGSVVEYDPADDLETRGKKTTVYTTSGGEPSDPSPPANTKIVSSYTVQHSQTKSSKVWKFEPQTSKDKIEQGGTFVKVDASGIRSVAQGVAVNGSPAAPSGLVARFTTTQALSDFNTKTEVDYGVQTVKQEIENDNTEAIRSFIDADINRIATVGTSSSDAATIANTILSSFRSESFALRLNVKKLTPDRYMAVKEYYDPGVMVVGKSYARPTPVEARYNAASDIVEVYVSSVKQFDTTWQWVQVTPARITGYIRRFTLIRWFPAGTTIPEFLNQIGKVNNATFLGLDTGTCYYEGPEYSCKLGNPNSGPFRMGYNFYADSIGIFDLFTWQSEFLSDAEGLAVGWTDAEDLWGAGIYTLPDQADFSGFLA
jgi:hypothetical protein